MSERYNPGILYKLQFLYLQNGDDKIYILEYKED